MIITLCFFSVNS